MDGEGLDGECDEFWEGDVWSFLEAVEGDEKSTREDDGCLEKWF